MNLERVSRESPGIKITVATERASGGEGPFKTEKHCVIMSFELDHSYSNDVEDENDGGGQKKSKKAKVSARAL